MKVATATRKASKVKAPKERGAWGRKLPKCAEPVIAGSHCFYCMRKLGKPVPANRLDWDSPTIDHVKARSAGGTDDTENLVRVCWGCNHAKGGMPPSAWFGDLSANDQWGR